MSLPSSVTLITVAHFAANFKSHLAQVIVPLRETSLSSALTPATKATSNTRLRIMLKAILIGEPPRDDGSLRYRRPHTAKRTCLPLYSGLGQYSRADWSRQPTRANHLCQECTPAQPGKKKA